MAGGTPGIVCGLRPRGERAAVVRRQEAAAGAPRTHSLTSGPRGCGTVQQACAVAAAARGAGRARTAHQLGCPAHPARSAPGIHRRLQPGLLSGSEAWSLGSVLRLWLRVGRRPGVPALRVVRPGGAEGTFAAIGEGSQPNPPISQL